MGQKQYHKSRRKRSKSNPLLYSPVYQGDNNIPTTVTLFQYDSKQMSVKDLTSCEHLKNEIDNSKVNWLKIVGISDAERISRICYEFGLHGFDIRDLMSNQQVVKVVTYDKVTFILMPGFYIKEEENYRLEDMQVAFILGDNYVVSFQESDIPVFEDVQAALKENQMLIRQNGNDYLLYLLLRVVNTLNNNTVMEMEDGLDGIEDSLLLGHNDKNIMPFVRIRRLDYTHVKRFIVSLREEFINLLRNTNKLILDENIVYFNDFDDKLRVTLSNLESFHESLVSLLDIYYNNNNLRMNGIMKQLTIVSTIFIPLTFLVGVWGMNFKFMPELDCYYGYMVAWILFIVIGLVVWAWMKRKRWF